VSKACSVCSHKNRDQIDKCLLSKTSYRNIKERFGVSLGALNRHVNEGHIKKAVEESYNAEESKKNLDVATCAREIYDLAMDSAKAAKKANQFSAIGTCLAPAAKVLDILSKGEPSNINLNVSSDADLNAKLERIVERRKA
jgi:hypothetical protein